MLKQIVEREEKNEDIILDVTNKRVILYQYDSDWLEEELDALKKAALKQNIDKITVYGQEEDISLLRGLPLKKEGEIEGFFDGETAFIYSIFLNQSRTVQPLKEEQRHIIESAQEKNTIPKTLDLPEGFELRRAKESDVIEMANVFGKVFKSYPTPMNEPKYVKKVMKEDTLFSLVTHEDRIVSIASADINPKYNNAEITDCATLPEYRGKGLLTRIMFHLEDRLRVKEVPNLFSLTRAQSYGMNHAVAKHGYGFQGTLIQNCDISGSFEDMNIWVKILKT
ncbi:GCN5-related N-acetyltransferase [Alkaliphilus metalliredigens QYMF]|uniref:GCN5-related N-acetyltransferase n=1 Tax=Alkaliphilus metalliredigens (strain QYMF) TaxID=293826 RepID=A6TUB1_ALKMQ|nr:putative beta-lysine N-acetyltransferase [Alkaliphilus metalliredigens]ABR49779.1 GCN5-related N-acetyltransferase [Alkaliphilus metalliredigens QYMF]